MKQLFCILFSVIFLPAANAGTVMQQIPPQTITPKEDTTTENIAEEDAIIEDIIQTKKAPQKEKVQYISQIGRAHV